MVAMPIVATILPLEIAVPSSTLLVLALNIQLAWAYRKYVRWQALKFIFLGGIFGSGAGLWILSAVNGRVLKIIMGILLVFYALHSLRKQKSGDSGATINTRWGLPAGFFSTLLGTLFGFNGPPLAVFTSLSGWTKETAKGILGTCFILTGITILCGQFLAGIQNARTFHFFISAFPAVLLGGSLGILASKRVGQNTYKRIVLTLILAAGLSILWTSLG